MFILFVASQVFAGDNDKTDNKLLTGAAVGAGTNVIGGAVLDSLDGTSKPQFVQVQGPDGNWYWQQTGPAPEDPNKVILKRAVQGAITGAVAAEVAGGGKEGAVSPALSNALDDNESDQDEDGGKKRKKDKGEKGHRPPGWDRGKKVGWGEGDIPPGQRDKD